MAHGYREELLLLPFRAEVGWPAPLNITRALASYIYIEPSRAPSVHKGLKDISHPVATI